MYTFLGYLNCYELLFRVCVCACVFACVCVRVYNDVDCLYMFPLCIEVDCLSELQYGSGLQNCRALNEDNSCVKS